MLFNGIELLANLWRQKRIFIAQSSFQVMIYTCADSRRPQFCFTFFCKLQSIALGNGVYLYALSSIRFNRFTWPEVIRSFY